MSEIIKINRYHNGKIYKIWSLSTDKIYIGSTCEPTLARRLANHVGCYKRYLSGKGYYMASYELLKLDDYRIELIENFNCESKNELYAREGYFIRLHKEFIVNKKIECRTRKEYKKENEAKIKEQDKEYRKENEAKIKEYQKEYKEQNKEKIKEYIKEYQEQNKEKIKEKDSAKMLCACGSEISYGYKARHERTIKHLNLLKALQTGANITASEPIDDHVANCFGDSKNA